MGSLCLFKCLLIDSIFDSSCNFITELLSDLVLIYFIHFIIDFIIMLMLLRFLGYHKRIVLLTITVGIALHDISHIKCSLMCDPVIQYQQLLSHCLCTGFFYFLYRFITFFCNSTGIVLNTKLISIIEVLDHSHEIVKRIGSTSYLIYSITCENKHLSQNTQTILFIIIITEEKRLLYTK